MARVISTPMNRYRGAPVIALMVWLLASGIILASPINYPMRMVNGHSVSLQPLIDWWSTPKGIRPLSGWKHVQGTFTRDTGLGWIVTGKAEGQPRASSFFLKNPPRDRLRRFNELKPRLAALEDSRAKLLEALRRPVHSAWYWPGSNAGEGAPLSQAEHKQLAAQLTGIDQKIRQVSDELAPMQGPNGEFKLDAFALFLAETVQGLPAFDHGIPLHSATYGN